LVHPPTLLPLLLLMMPLLPLPPLEVEVVESIVMLSNDGFHATPLPSSQPPLPQLAVCRYCYHQK